MYCVQGVSCHGSDLLLLNLRRERPLFDRGHDTADYEKQAQDLFATDALPFQVRYQGRERRFFVVIDV